MASSPVNSQRPLRIALATCSQLPNGDPDDAPFLAALETRGWLVEQCDWRRQDIDWSQFDACVVRTTWDYTNAPGAFRRWIDAVAAQTHLLNPAEAMAWNLHKGYLRELEQRGVRIAPTVWLPRGPAPAIAELMEQRSWGRGMLKPVIGATARETLRFDADVDGWQAAQEHAARLCPAEEMMLQPYFPSVETQGEMSAIFFGEELTHAVRKVPQPGDYRVQDNFDAHDEPYDLSAAEAAWARQVLAAAPQRLTYARVDFLHDDAGIPHLLELEIVEPSLFFRHAPEAAAAFVGAIASAVGAGKP